MPDFSCLSKYSYDYFKGGSKIVKFKDTLSKGISSFKDTSSVMRTPAAEKGFLNFKSPKDFLNFKSPKDFLNSLMLNAHIRNSTNIRVHFTNGLSYILLESRGEQFYNVREFIRALHETRDALAAIMDFCHARGMSFSGLASHFSSGLLPCLNNYDRQLLVILIHQATNTLPRLRQAFNRFPHPGVPVSPEDHVRSDVFSQINYEYTTIMRFSRMILGFNV